MSEVGDWLDKHPLDDLERMQHTVRCPACDSPMQGMRRHQCLVIGRSKGPADVCIRGHVQSGDNVRIVKSSGKRRCRICERARSAAYYRRTHS